MHLIKGKRLRCIFLLGFFLFRQGQESERTRNHTSTVRKIKFVERKAVLSGSTIYPTAPRLKSLEKELSER